MMSEIIHTILASLASALTLFILTKLMGKRQIAQLSLFDYANGITIGSIAAEMATAEFTDLVKPFVAMIVYTIIIIACAILSYKSLKFRHFAEGKASILYNNGELYKANLKQANMDVDEFLCLCRINGYFDLSKLQTAILESNGSISCIPLSTERPATPADFNLKPEQEYMVANVIIDGEIMTQNLRHTGNNEQWLENQLQAKGIKQLSEVFLATCDSNNKLTIYKTINEKMKVDVFE